jgi:hypothetical protein
MLENLPLSNIIETSEECIHVHQRHQDIMKPALIAGRGGEGKNKKTKSQNINPTKLRRKLSTYLSSCEVERMLGLKMFYFSSSKQGRERTCRLTIENPEFRR